MPIPTASLPAHVTCLPSLLPPQQPSSSYPYLSSPDKRDSLALLCKRDSPIMYKCKGENSSSLFPSPLNPVPGSVQLSSVAQSCPTLCDPMNRSTPGLPVHHQLPESTQTHVHCVNDAIQPSHPLSSPSPPALNLSQHQGLFQ